MNRPANAMKTVIMAGGRGSRIQQMFPDIPKPLIKISDLTGIEYEILTLKNQGLSEFIVTVSHLAEKIIDSLGDGKRLGVSIEYYIENEPLGNAGALFEIKDRLTEDFFLINADSVFNIDINRVIEFHNDRKGVATIVTHPNNHPYDSGLIEAEKDGKVIKWLTKEDIRPQWYKNRVNAGIHILNKSIFHHAGITAKANGGNEKVDLDRNILRPLVPWGELYCYDCTEYIKDMGTPERYEEVRRDLYDGIIEKKCLKNRQRAVFLDRDGTINKHIGFLKDIDQFELIEGVPEAIKVFNDLGFLVIVVTNQPVIARGEVSESELDEIHNKMETLLGNKGAFVDAIYYCPHHPDKGYKGEKREFKIQCNCRKPKPGMLYEAANRYNIDLGKSWMVGDSESDVYAGNAAGCKTVLLNNINCGQNLNMDSLIDFAMYLKKDMQHWM